jgi:hypothetical protein
MSNLSTDDKIYVDAGQPATLRRPGNSMRCYTLAEAAMAWHRLPADQKATATIKVDGGRLYIGPEIELLHYGPRP